jgi:hypothetical protein
MTIRLIAAIVCLVFSTIPIVDRAPFPPEWAPAMMWDI